jgi:hypothetical protein
LAVMEGERRQNVQLRMQRRLAFGSGCGRRRVSGVEGGLLLLKLTQAGRVMMPRYSHP